MTTRIMGVGFLETFCALVRAFPARASAAGGLLLAVLLAALPPQAVAQTQGVSISVSPAAFPQYVTIEEGEDVTFTVKRTGDSSNALTVNYTITGGGGPANLTAERAGEGDYTSIPTSYEFPAGSSASHAFTVTAVDDEVYEPRQYFTLTASGSYQDEGSTISFSKQVIVRITENDERYLTLSPVSDSALPMVSHPEFMAKEGGTGNENQLTINLNEQLPYDLNIGYTVGSAPHTTAATSDDFTMSGGTATILGGNTSVTIDVGIVDDSLVEPTEYFTLLLRTPAKALDPGNAKGTFKTVNFQESKVRTQPLSVSIMDNDTAPAGGVVYLRGEGGGGIMGFPSTRKTLTEGQSVTITAEIAGAAPTNDIRIPLKFDHYPSGEATSADHNEPGPIIIKAGQKSGSVTLTIRDDADDERYRELLVVEINDTNNFPTGYTKGDRSKYEVVMLDNDKTPASLLSLSKDKLTETQGDRTATFQLRIDRRPKAAPSGDPPFTGADVDEGDAKLVLGYTGKAMRGGTADYTSTADTFVIRKSPAALPNGCSAAGEAVTCTVTLNVRDDNLYEGGVGTTEDVKVNLDTGTGNSSFNDGFKKPMGLSLTIEDNDPQPMFSIADVSGPENGNLTFTVTRSGALGNDVSVTAKTGNHGDDTKRATADTDYTAKTQKLDFGQGGTSKDFVVAITDDIVDEPDETFAVTLSNPVDNQGLPKPAIATEMGTAVGTITDNDDAPTELTISVDTTEDKEDVQDTIAEAAGETTVSVTATIDSPTRFATDQTVTVTVGNAANEGEASEGESGDYETVDQFTITIPATQKSGKGTFKLTPVNDRIDDDDEKISVEGELGTMTVTHATITIKDDDTRGIVVVSPQVTIDEADDTNTSPPKKKTGTYSVRITSQPEGGTVTVNVASKDTTVAAVSNSSLKFHADNWDHAQLVTVTAQDDTIDNTGNERATTITHTVSADGTDYAGEDVEDVEVTVHDDDEAPTALKITVDTDTGADDDQDTISEGASSPTVRITATLDGETQFGANQTITITVGDNDNDTATEGEGGDYATVNDFDITLPVGDTSVSKDLTLTLNDDSVDEPDETVTVAGELARVTVKGTSFTIEDNDDTPTVTLVLTPESINESGATNASTVTATMDGESSEAVTLTVSATPVDPAVAGDLALSENTTLSIPANTQASAGVVTITAVDNDVDAADKTVTVAATATGGNALVKAPGSQTLTITDDDTRGITVSKAALTLDEEDNAATMDADEHQDTYTVALDSEPSGGTVTIGVASGDTTVAGVAPATLTFTASNWNEPQTVTVTAVADGIDNPNDRRVAAITHTVTATGTDYEGATASGVTVTVNDDDGAPTLSINDPSVTEELDDGATAMLTFTVQLKPADGSGNTVTVDYADAGTGTATSGGTDYATLASGTLTFMPGETSKPVAVTVSGDDIHESDETVVVRLSSPSNATLTGGATTLDGTGTINDNDPTPTVSVADATAVSEGNVAAPDPPNNMTFAVTLSAVSGLEVTVPYTLAGTATAGTDYTEPDPRSVMIAAGQTQANIAIPVAGDEVDEENETITVTLGMPTNATVSTAEGAGAASGTITDDDTRGVSVTPTALTVAEADNAGTAATRENQETYKVVLTSEPTGAVTVNLESGDESVARIDTASLVFGTGDWNTERTVTVTGQADVIDNTGNERTTTIAHTVSAAGTDYADETAEGVTVTVTDDDAAPSGITLTANPDSVTENGGAKTVTVTAAVNGATRYAQARTVSVSVGGGTAISGTDYTAVDSFDITIGAGEDDASNTFTLTPDNDVLAEGNETIDVTGILSGITITPDEITLTDDDAVPSGITLSVDTNGAEDGTPSTVAEDAGATVVTVTATVNGATRYVDARTVAVSVADGTAESPADYAAVDNFNITIAAGAASHTGSFTVTPVDDDLDEANETINVTGTLSSVTIAPATVTFTDNDDPVSFSIADAEATEGGKVAFTVSREGAGDNLASVRVTTATDSSDGANAADADDYTATAQTLNFAKGVTSQTVEVQTTQDDLFELDETFKATLSAPALAEDDPGTGVSIETDKGTAIGTIKNDDTEPSFAVADASAAEGDAITFTVTRSGAMDNAVSVKWNTKPDSGAGAASATDYTPVTAPTVLNFARGASSRTFTVATTEDVLAEGDETFLVELTEPVGGTIATAEATGTITDDDAAPTGITLSVDADTGTNNVQSSIAEEGGVKTVRVTATINGATRFATAQTVTVTVGKDGDSATEGADYSNVAAQSIEIPIGAASAYVDFMLTPTTDVLFEGSETISLEGTLTGVTFTNSSITITDDDAAPSAITLSVDADTGTNNVQSSIAEEGGVKTVRVTATIGGTTRFATAQTVTVTVGKDGDSATEGTDYAMVDAQSIEIPIGAASAYVDFMLTPTTDVLFEGSETISLEGTHTGVTFTNSSITITDDDAAPSAITLSVDTNAGGDGTPTTLGEGATATTVRVTATITSATRFATEQTVKVKVGKDGDSATGGTDYALVADQNIKIPAGAESAYVDFSLTPTHDILDEADETISVDGELTGVTFTAATITINDDDAAPQFITLAVDTNAGGNGTPTSVGEEAGDTTVRVTATITSATRFAANQAVTFEVGKSADSATEDTDYTEVGTLTITIDGGDASGYVDFTLTPTSDVLDESNETISVHGTQANITFTDATITITDDDAAPSGITLSVDTNGSTAGTPSTVAEDAGATVVTVTATVNGTTRYVDARTVAVSVADDTAASPADYAAVSGFNITIAAGAASQTGSFTVTPVDDDLDESDETIDVTGTLTDITVTGATVTLTDTDNPVSFSIADAEATEGGKVTFTVNRGGAGDNVASVKIATAADSGDGVNAADADDYTAIAAAQTLNFAAGTTSQTVEVQTTQDDLFEPDETFKAVLSAPALAENDPGTGASIESGKGTATGTIRNDDTKPSFAVADASAAEGDAITFTVTRSGAMDNAVSVKWNTKADSSADANAAFASDYTPVTTARTLTFAKGVSSQTFTVATTEDVLDEENETFLVELTGAVGATIATAEATGTITDDDAAPTGITLTVSPAMVGEEDGKTKITVTATVNGATRYVDAKTVTVSVGGDSAISDTDYDAVANFDITIAAGDASHTGTFDLTPTDDDLYEGSETIEVTGTSNALTITKASITLEDDDTRPSFAVTDASATEGDAITFTVTRSGAMDNAVSVKWNTKADSSDGANAASATDYTPVTTATTLTFAKGVSSQTFTVATTEDTLNEANETFLVELTEAVGGTITTAEATGTINDDDAAPTTLTLAVDADNNTENVQSSLAENGGVKTVKVTATLGGSTQFDVDKTLTLIVGDDDDSATEGTDYTNVADVTLTIPAGDQDVEHTFTLTPTDDAFNEASETISFDATITGVTVAGASITLTSDDAAPAITLTVDADKDTDNVQTSLAEDGGVKTVRVTATLDGATRLEEAADLTLAVGKDGDSAVEGADYTTVADRTITIGAGVASVIHDFTLTPTNDDIDEPDEGISIEGTLTGITVAGTSLTITDDEGTPTVTLALTPTAIDESGNGNASTVTATLSGKSSAAVTVEVSVPNDAPVTLSNNTTLTIAAGATTSTGAVTITAVDNDVDAANASVVVSGAASGGGVTNPADQTLTITDDEGTPTASLMLTPGTINESGATNSSTVTATLSGKSNTAVTLTVVAAAGANTAAGDFTLSGTTLTIAAGATTSTGTVTITAVDNDIDAPNKTVTVSATASGGGVANPGNQTLTITDDEGVPTVTLALDPTTIDESGDDNASTVTAILSGKSSVAVTLTVAAAPGADTAAGDFTLSGTTLTIAAGATTSAGAVTITAVDNNVDAPNKSVTVSATASGGGVANPANQTLTINDDDAAPSGITLSVSPATVGEEDGETEITVTATVNGATRYADAQTVTVSVGGGTAISGTDYDAAPSFDITIAAGDASKAGTFDLTPTNDVLDEANETINVTGTSGSLTITPTTVTINDDDAAPGAITISVDADTGAVGTQTTIAEDGGAKTVRVTATITDETRFVEAKTVTLEVGADADSAEEGTDYANLGTQNITIDAGESSGYVEFTLTPTQDVLHEGSETISLDGTLAGVTVTDASMTLTDDDAAPTGITLTVSPATVGEGAGETEITVTATVNGTTRYVDAKTVTVSVGGGTATSDTDYGAVPNFDIIIAAGDASKVGTFDLTPTQDDLHEGSETINLDGTVTGVTVTDTSLTLTDDDGQPSFAVADASASEGDAVTFTVTRSGAMENAVSVKWNTKADSSDGANAASATDYTAMTTATKLDFASGVSSQTFTVATTEDMLHEGNETFLVELTDPVGATISTAEATGTITDDDAAPTMLTLSVDADTGTMGTQTSLAEDGGAKMVRVTATLVGTSTFTEAKTVTVEVGADADSAEEGTDYTEVTRKSITINAGESSGYVEFTLTPTDDDIDEPSEGISIEGTLTSVTVTGTSLTITDDEGTPTVTLVLMPSAINESGNGNASTVTATLSGKSNEAVTLTVAAAAGADTAAGDFTLSATTTLTIAAGATTSAGAVTITAVDNNVDAPNKSVTVSATASGGGVANPANQTLTINDDEGVPTVTLALTPSAINESGNGNASTVTATLSGKSSAAVTVEVSVPNDAPVTVTANKTLTIAAGATTSAGVVTITAVDNDVDAPNKNVTVSATASGGGVANPADQTLTITDDEGVPTVTLALTPTTINESGNGNASTVTATLSGESSAAVTVTVSVPNDAPVTLSSATTLTIAAGATTSAGAVTITAVDNDVDAPNKSVTVSATASGGGVANPADQTLTINDDEGVPTVTLALDPTTINESGNGNASTVTATLSGESSAAVTVMVSVPNDAPVTLSANKTLTIAAGSKVSAGAVTITAVDNDVDAPNASVVVSGVAAGGSVANPDNQTLTITDDEGTPTVTLALTPSAINESGATNSSTVTATLLGKSNTAVTLTVAAAAGADTVAGDFTLSANKTLTIAAGATTSAGAVKITAVDNDVDAPNKSVTVSATASGGGVANPDNQTLTINDDDAAPSGITLSVSPATLDEGDGLTRITVTAAVNGTTRYVDARTVTVSVGGGTAISGTDYGAAPNFDIGIAAGATSHTGTFDLTPTDDTLREEDETIEVTGSSGALTITPAMITITDNDNAGPVGTVSLSTSRYEVLEGDSLSVTVNLSEAPAADTMIELEATSPGGYSATPGADYDGGVQTVTIRAGTTSGKARISTTRDNQNDPNETFKLAIRASGLPGAVTLGEPDTAVVTIREPVSGITPPETATVVYAGRHSRILMPVPAGLKGHGIDVAFYFDIGPGTAQGGGDCREPGTDVVDWGHWPSYPEGMVRTGPLVRIAEDINTDTIELEIELCEGSVGKTFTASWDSLQWLGNPDRGFPGVKSYPFNAAAAHCTSTVLCWTEVTIVDDDPVVPAGPEITITAGADTAEGGDAAFTVQASPAPTSDLDVTLAIADDAVSDFLADGDEGSKTVTIAAGSDMATYTLATTDNDLEEENGGVSATLEAGAGYRVGSPSTATVTVADNDGDDNAQATVVRISGGDDITEGGVARFTLTGAPAPSQDITVNLRVTQSGAFAGDGELGARVVTLGTDATTTIDIPTIDDSTLEDDGILTITAEPGTGYTLHATNASATVAVADDEDPLLPTIHIGDAEAEEGDDVHFMLTLSHPVDHNVVVYWETRFGTNYHDASNGHGPSYGSAVPRADFVYADSQVTIYAGSTRGEFWVETLDDSHDEGRETFTIVLTEATGGIIADELATGAIINSDPVPAAWLGRFGRTVAEQAIEGVSERIEAVGTPGRATEPGLRGAMVGSTFGAQRGGNGDAGSGADACRRAEAPQRRYPPDCDTSQPVSDDEAKRQFAQMLLDSRFTYTGEADEAGGVLGYWGRGAQTRFDGGVGKLNLDGKVTTAMLGVDYARNNWLVGMALAQTRGSGGYRRSDTALMDGAIDTTLTAAIPYASWRVSERLNLWGAAGYGMGKMTLEPGGGESLRAGIDWTMAAAGLRADLFSSAGGTELALISDALRADTGSDRIDGLVATDSSVSRLRLGIEASRLFSLPGGGGFTPSFELGARHDDGSAETGFGVEAGGGIAWTDPRFGLKLDLLGRTLISHEDDAIGERGFSASLAFDPWPDSEQGLALILRQDIGATSSGGLEALFANDPLARRTSDSDSSSLTTELGYGTQVLGGRFIGVPHLGYSLTRDGNEIGLGWRLAPAKGTGAPDFTLGALATRAESLQGEPAEHRLRIEIQARW